MTWKTDAHRSEPAPDLSVATESPGFYQDLLASSAEIIPVVGSGMTVEAGVPGFRDLTSRLESLARSEGFDLAPVLPVDGFNAVDMITAASSPGWVQCQVARIVAAASPEPTPSLQALAKVRSGIIVTTNYDLALEAAAQQVGREVRILTVEDIGEALEPPGPLLRVLHLHGVCTRPESIVLTHDSYDAILHDERSQLVLRALAIRFRLVFLGHSLAPREIHIRRDVNWAITASRGAPDGRHVLVTDQRSIDEIARDFRDELEEATQIKVWMFDDPDGAYQASKRAAFVISGPAPVGAGPQAVPLSGFDPHYVPVPVAETDEISENGGRRAYMARLWRHGTTSACDLDRSVSRLLLVAGGGMGKSEELRQIARRSTRPALYQTLTSWDVDSDWTDTASKFVSVMGSAQGTCATGGPVARLDHDTLRDASLVFLLDGLDEVSQARLPRAIRLIREVGAAFPQHRIVVSSRPLDSLPDLIGFERYALVKDFSWLVEYTKRRGLPIDMLEAALPTSTNLQDLIRIPIFAAAAVNIVQSGKPLPLTALELVCHLADERTDNDTRTEVDPSQLRRWLDRVALTMEMAGVSELETRALSLSQLHHGLPAIVPNAAFITRLCQRALLAEAGGTVRFPANIIGEARTSRALLNSDTGIEVVTRYALVELDSGEPTDDPVRAVRLSWINTLELLLAAAGPEWRVRIAEFDPALAARATPDHASDAERDRAAWTIWNLYLTRGVWLSRADSHGSGDGAAMTRLLQLRVPEGFQSELLRAVTDPEPTLRGNALELIPVVLAHDEAVAVVRTAITDPDPVVRRQAASAAVNLKATGLASEMAAQARIDNDDIARQTLLDFAVELAEEEDAIQLALQGSPKDMRRAFSRLTAKVPRIKLLDVLTTTGPQTANFVRELVRDPGPFTARPPWTADEVAALVDVLAVHPSELRWEPDVERVLHAYPLVAVFTWLRHTEEEELAWQLKHLVLGLNHSDIDSTMALLLDPTPATLESAGIPADERPILDKPRLHLLTYLADLRQKRQTPPAPEAVLTNIPARPSTEPVVNNDQLTQLFANNEVASAVDSNTKTVSVRVLDQLRAGAERDAPLDPNQCVQLFTFLLEWLEPALTLWLERQWTREAARLAEPSIGAVSNDRLSDIARTLPTPWPPTLAAGVLDAAGSLDGRDNEKLQIAGYVLDKDPEALRPWAARTRQRWIDPLLVTVGDCAAERRLVTKLITDPSALERHPTGPETGWINDLSCPSTTTALTALIRSTLASGKAFAEVDAVYHALSRCAGPRAPWVWNGLIADETIPHRHFFYYPRQEAIDDLVGRTPISATTPAAEDAHLQEVAVASVPPT
jgi:hypothetical protein